MEKGLRISTSIPATSANRATDSSAPIFAAPYGELARKVSDRLAALAVYGGSCPCGNAELRAHLAELRRIEKSGA